MNLENLVGRIRRSESMVVFTGAGISTESGIPDFRGPKGLWKKYRPVELQDFLSSREDRAEYWRRKIELYPNFTKARPNKGHTALAELYRLNYLKYIITQNIDGLHQEAGMPEDRVIELHGTGRFISCLDCGKRFEWPEILPHFYPDGTLDPRMDTPLCDSCGGYLKPATISFGQAMPEKEITEASLRAVDSDLFIAVGSSLQVYPAAALPQEAARTGGSLVIINNEPTPLDRWADEILRGQAGEILEALSTALGDSR